MAISQTLPRPRRRAADLEGREAEVGARRVRARHHPGAVRRDLVDVLLVPGAAGGGPGGEGRQETSCATARSRKVSLLRSTAQFPSATTKNVEKDKKNTARASRPLIFFKRCGL